MSEEKFDSGENDFSLNNSQEGLQTESVPQQDSYQQDNLHQQGDGYQQSRPYQQYTGYQQENPYQQNTGYQQTYQEPYQPVSETFGIVSLILGIVSLVFFCTCCNVLLAIAAIVLGIIHLTKEKTTKGYAIGGILTAVLSIILFGLTLVGFVASSDYQDIVDAYEEAADYDDYSYDEYDFEDDDTF